MPAMSEILSDGQAKNLKNKFKPTKNDGTKVPYKKFNNNNQKPNKGLVLYSKKYPEWVNRCTILARNNADFRRLLTLTLQELHREAGQLGPEKGYVKIRFNKYSLRNAEGLITEYSMKTKLFATAFAAAIIAFDEYAQHTIAEYVRNEFDKNPLNDTDLAKANDIVKKIEVVPPIIEIDENDNNEE